MFAWRKKSASASQSPPMLLRFRSSRTYIIVTISTAIFTDIFAYGIVVPVLPFALESRVGVEPDSIQRWVSILLAVYGAALFVASPFCGWAADRMSSRRMPLLAGLLALGASTAMLCVARGIPLFAAGRVLQGVSAAVVWVVGLALLVDTVGPDEIGTAMGYVGLSMSLAVLVAPLLGGVVFETAGYYATFAMAFGLIAVDIFLRLTMIEVKVAKQWLPEAGEAQRSNDTAQKDRLPEDTVPSPVESVVQTPAKSETEAPSIPPLLRRLSSTAPPAVVKWFDRLPPILSLLASRRVLSALWVCLIQASLYMSFDSILPIFVKDTFQWNSIGAGLIFLPLVIASFLGPIVGWMSDKYGPRWFATVGFILSTPLIILLRLVDHDSLRQKVLLCALLCLIGITLTLVLVPMMAEIAYAVDAKARRHPPGHYGKNGAYAQAYSLFNMSWAGGAMIGPLLGGLINSSSGWPAATLVLGCVSGATIVPTFIWTGGSIRKQRAANRERDGNQV